MVSLLLPSELRLRFTPGLLVMEGPRGVARLSPGTLRLRLVETPAGRRLVVEADAAGDRTASTTFLAHIARRREGVMVGVRRRLRLVGVGFRATVTQTTPSGPVRALKLGYREERQIALEPLKSIGVDLSAARLEGRSKGTLIRVEGLDRERVNRAAADLRNLRRPDSYKGKGIQYDHERLTLKKGKRE